MFKFAQDDDGHWFIIPADRDEEFEEWASAMENDLDYEGYDFSDCMIGCSPTMYVFNERPKRL